MKKITLLLLLTLGFSFTALAQDKNAQNEMNAKNEIEALVKVVTIDQAKQDMLLNVLKKKHEATNRTELNDSQKEQIAGDFAKKIKAMLGDAIVKQLESHPEVLKKILSAAQN